MKISSRDQGKKHVNHAKHVIGEPPEGRRSGVSARTPCQPSDKRVVPLRPACRGLSSAAMLQPPIITAVEGQDVGTIWVSWHSDASGIQKFWVARKKVYDPQGSLPVTFSFPGSTGSFYDTTDIEPYREYRYRVGAQYSDGSIDWSLPKYGSALGYEFTFDEADAFIANSSEWEGYTLVQRIEAAALRPISRQQVKRVVIRLYGSEVQTASIDRVFISRPDPAPGAKPYDSDPDDLTEVPLPQTPLVVPKTHDVQPLHYDLTEVPLPQTPLVVPKTSNVQPLHFPVPGVDLTVDYIVRPQVEPLLIAVDFTRRPTASAVRRSDAPPARAVAYWFQYDPPPPGQPVPPEAGLARRSAGYATTPRVYGVGHVLIG